MGSRLIAVLNDLAETSKDSERDFRKAAGETLSRQLRPLFTSRANDCSHDALELGDIVARLGGRPHTHGTLTGALHRGWLDLRTVFAARDDREIIEERTKGEELARKHYREALDEDLPADVRLIVERQYRGVLYNHARLDELRVRYTLPLNH
ncbi:PA2169 family four-helix-bundle protein [Trinickia fusca]|uniref:PA2169 family four-helix-bundle protein n=1 Tax=Trinickia fusca TaxID=2419777 RepID=A0A494X3G7_9BURK|nr:PA2169 family four-helix-bundle protein [Trinickia fusca]RKP44890.1 PA2169 family four-helix-bundle protein [Trinickia fusca]